jgi:hypothetical protein
MTTTSRYYLVITCKMVGPSEPELDALFEPLADAVADLSDVIDADLGANTAEGLFNFTMAIDAPDEVSALQMGLVAVRSAVHAAGGATPGWEQNFEAVELRRGSALAPA